MRLSALRRYYSAIPKRGTLLWQVSADDKFMRVTIPHGGTVHRWHVDEGDKVKRHDRLLSLEIDKMVYDVRARLEGTIVSRLVREGQEVDIDERIVIIAHEEDDE